MSSLPLARVSWLAARCPAPLVSTHGSVCYESLSIREWSGNRKRRRGEERRQRRGSGETRWRGVKGRKRGAEGRVDQRERRQKKKVKRTRVVEQLDVALMAKWKYTACTGHWERSVCACYCIFSVWCLLCICSFCEFPLSLFLNDLSWLNILQCVSADCCTFMHEAHTHIHAHAMLTCRHTERRSRDVKWWM